MLILKRLVGDWTEITGADGNRLRVKVLRVRPGEVELGFEDDSLNFVINRPERVIRVPRSELTGVE